MFMPYFFSEKTDTLTVVSGIGIAGSTWIFLISGFGVMLFSGGTLPPSGELAAGNIVAIAVTMGIAAFLILFRVAITINRRTGIITKRWGSILVFRHKEFALDDYTRVVMTRKRKGSGSSCQRSIRIVFDISLHAVNKSLRLRRVEPGWRPSKAEEKAKRFKERIEKFARFDSTNPQ